MDSAHVEQRLKAYILREFLAGEDESKLTSTTPLISAGVLDSIATLRLVTFIEQEFGVSLEAHEADADNLDSIEKMVQLVGAKFQ